MVEDQIKPNNFMRLWLHANLHLINHFGPRAHNAITRKNSV